MQLSAIDTMMRPLSFADTVNTSGAGATTTTQTTATNAFGLGFEDLLRIVLTQLTYQDPLKPMDNFEFVSQLAQFSQIQQTQNMSDQLAALVQSDATLQATGLLGRMVDVPSGSGVTTGKVTSISFQSGQPLLTIETSDGATISSIALSTISRVALEQ